MRRLFIAIDMPIEIIKVASEIQDKLKESQLFNGSFVQSQKLHLTIKFLGNINEEQILQIKQSLQKIEFKSFEATLNGIGFFPEHIVKIIWLGIDSDGIKKLQNKIEQSLSWLEKPVEKFVCHLTIARIKSVKNRNELKEFIAELEVPKIKFFVNSFILKESQLTDKGSIYIDLEKYYSI